VLTGQYDNGLGQKMNVPDRVDFDPFPYQSMAVWILTQMKRWGYIKGDVDYQKVAAQVFLADSCREVLKSPRVQGPGEEFRHAHVPDRQAEELRSAKPCRVSGWLRDQAGVMQ
jgi:nitrate/nitrite transport system substrate-binding protein